MTFKQLEALYWSAQLGGFSPAAQKLCTTQSAISKRVQELEALFNTPLFDRSLRTARLTDKGEEMFLLSKKLLEHRDSVVEQFVSPQVIERRVRIGVTELTAMTWLPRLVALMQLHFPKVIIEPDVDMSVSLRDKLLADEVDLMIVPSSIEDSRFTSMEVGTVENAWMCKPGVLDTRKTLRMPELAAHRLLVQGDKSGTGLRYQHWLAAIGVTPTDTLVSNSLLALIGMTISGLGISYLPLKCLHEMLNAGALEVIKATPALPKTVYMAACKREQRGSLVSSVIMLAQEACDFTRLFQTDTPAESSAPSRGRGSRTRRRDHHFD